MWRFDDLNFKISFLFLAVLIISVLYFFEFGSFTEYTHIEDTAIAKASQNEVTKNQGNANQIPKPENTKSQTIESDNKTEISKPVKTQVEIKHFGEYKSEYTEEGFIKKYQKEAEKDPHSVPPSLYEVANKMAQDLKKAKKSKEDGFLVFEKFVTCALASPEKELNFVRAACAENAKILADLYPQELKIKYTSMLDELPDDVLVLLGH